jgi:hypothetical protein
VHERRSSKSARVKSRDEARSDEAKTDRDFEIAMDDGGRA